MWPDEGDYDSMDVLCGPAARTAGFIIEFLLIASRFSVG